MPGGRFLSGGSRWLQLTCALMHFVDEARKLRRFPADHEVGMSGDRVTAREPVAVALAIGRYVTNSSRRGIFTLCFASRVRDMGPIRDREMGAAPAVGEADREMERRAAVGGRDR